MVARKVPVVRFRVARPSEIGPAERNVVCLSPSDWDDWFKFSTLFDVTYIDADGQRHTIGGTKIGKFGLSLPGARKSAVPGTACPSRPTNSIG